MSVVAEGGWWPPGEGEPGCEWNFENTGLRLIFDGRDIDVVQVSPEGDRALVSIPVGAIARVLAEGEQP